MKPINSEEYYNKIARAYNNLYGEEQLQKALFLKRLVDFSGEDLILDIGSGTGHYLKVFKGKFVCVDPSKELLSKNPYEKYIAKAEALPFSDKHFDYTISLTAVQNFSNVSTAIDEIVRVTKKAIYISTMEVSKVNPVLKNILNLKGLKFTNKKFNKEIFYIIELK